MKKADGYKDPLVPPPKRMRRDSDRVEKSLQVTVIFGSPKSNCAGTGLCKIIGPEDNETISHCCGCQAVEAQISWLADEIILAIQKKCISLACYQRHFYDGYFLVQDAFEYLPGKWPEVYRMQVDPGCYSAQENEKYLELCFERSLRPQVGARINSYQSASNKIITHKILLK